MITSYVAVHGKRFFRWKGSEHYADGPRLVRTVEPNNYTALAPCRAGLSYDGKTWDFEEAPCQPR